MKTLVFLATLTAFFSTPALTQTPDTVLGVASYIGEGNEIGWISFDETSAAKSGDLVTLVFLDQDNKIFALRQDQLRQAADSDGQKEFPISADPALAGKAGLAILGSVYAMDFNAGNVTLQLSPESTPASLSTCFTNEGIQLDLGDGKNEPWQGYIPLGYDVEPTCDMAP